MGVAVLGCGPAGLLAAAAVELKTGSKPYIISKKLPSKIGGAQFLHMPIPNFTGDDPDGVIAFEKLGSEAVYALKVYGDMGSPTSWSAYPAGEHPVWNMTALYVKLWEHYQDNIIDQSVGAGDIGDALLSHWRVISTIPAPALCLAPELHRFTQQSVDITINTEHEEVFSLPEMTIQYNGRADAHWYRSSNIFGVSSTEWRQAPHRYPKVTVKKPLRTDCDCWPEVMRVGRYGLWKKGVLIHHAYLDVLRDLHV